METEIEKLTKLKKYLEDIFDQPTPAGIHIRYSNKWKDFNDEMNRIKINPERVYIELFSNNPRNYGDFAIRWAIVCAHEEILKALLEKHSQDYSVFFYGLLLLAVYAGSNAILPLLLEKIPFNNTDYHRVLDKAIKCRQFEEASILLIKNKHVGIIPYFYKFIHSFCKEIEISNPGDPLYSIQLLESCLNEYLKELKEDNILALTIFSKLVSYKKADFAAETFIKKDLVNLTKNNYYALKFLLSNGNPDVVKRILDITPTDFLANDHNNEILALAILENKEHVINHFFKDLSDNIIKITNDFHGSIQEKNISLHYNFTEKECCELTKKLDKINIKIDFTSAFHWIRINKLLVDFKLNLNIDNINLIYQRHILLNPLYYENNIFKTIKFSVENKINNPLDSVEKIYHKIWLYKTEEKKHTALEFLIKNNVDNLFYSIVKIENNSYLQNFLGEIFISCAQYNRVNYVKELLRLSGNNEIFTQNFNAIYYTACRYGSADFINFLLEYNIKPILKYGDWPIFIAAKLGYTPVLEIMFDKANMNPNALHGYPLRLACLYGKIECVKFLLKNEHLNPSLHNNSALALSLLRGHDEIVKLLLKDRRVNSYPLKLKENALLEALHENQWDKVQQLLEEASINIKLERECYYLHMITLQNYFTSNKELDVPPENLFEIFTLGKMEKNWKRIDNEELVSYFPILTKNKSITLTDYLFAIEENYKEIQFIKCADFLLNEEWIYGGFIPHMLIIQDEPEQFKEYIEHLKRNDPDYLKMILNTRDVKASVPPYIQNGGLEIRNALLKQIDKDNHSPIEREIIYDKTMLMSAVRMNNITIAKQLLELGADPGIPDKFGRYPVHIAAMLGNKDMLILLVCHGANIHNLDAKGNNVLYYALSTQETIQEELLEHRTHPFKRQSEWCSNQYTVYDGIFNTPPADTVIYPLKTGQVQVVAWLLSQGINMVNKTMHVGKLLSQYANVNELPNEIYYKKLQDIKSIKSRCYRKNVNGNLVNLFPLDVHVANVKLKFLKYPELLLLINYNYWAHNYLQFNSLINTLNLSPLLIYNTIFYFSPHNYNDFLANWAVCFGYTEILKDLMLREFSISVQNPNLLLLLITYNYGSHDYLYFNWLVNKLNTPPLLICKFIFSYFPLSYKNFYNNNFLANWAVYFNHRKIFKDLISKGFDIEIYFSYLISSNDYHLIGKLLNMNVVQESTIRNEIYKAATSYNNQLLDFFRRKNPNNLIPVIHHAIKVNDIEKCKLLYGDGIDLTVTGENQQTIFHIALNIENAAIQADLQGIQRYRDKKTEILYWLFEKLPADYCIAQAEICLDDLRKNIINNKNNDSEGWNKLMHRLIEILEECLLSLQPSTTYAESNENSEILSPPQKTHALHPQ